MSKLPLPDGWIEKYDPIHDHNYWVDTRTVPPRATWVHPYADEQNPQIGPADKLSGCELTDPPPYREKPERRHSFSGGKQGASLLLPNIAFPDKSMPDLNDHPHYEKRGLFAMLKDKVTTIKEEREERKRMEQLQRERHADMLLRQSYLRQQLYCGSAPYHRSYYGCTAADAYPTTYPPPPGPPTPGWRCHTTSGLATTRAWEHMLVA